MDLHSHLLPEKPKTMLQYTCKAQKCYRTLNLHEAKHKIHCYSGGNLPFTGKLQPLGEHA